MLKKYTSSLLVVIILLLSITAIEAQGGRMVGTTIIPTFSGPGLGYRVWVNPDMGYGIEAQPSWDFTDWNFRGRYMRTISTTENRRNFLLATVGYMTVNDSEESGDVSVDFSVSFITISFGAGFEKLFGVRKNKGWGLEIGLQIGKGTYDMEMDLGDFGTMTVEGEYKVSPLYFGGSFAYYFSK